MTLGEDTYVSVLRDLVRGLREQGFRRVLVVNGHGGNSFAAEHVAGDGVRWHDWWSSERVWSLVERTAEGSHASWTENFPWTRLPGVELPAEAKPRLSVSRDLSPQEVRALAGDGSYGGPYEQPDETMLEIWAHAVDEVRSLLEQA